MTHKMLHLAIEQFSCPKLGNSPEEYEDAWSWRPLKGNEGHRIAITDGATESSFAKLWAILLAESYTRGVDTGLDFFDTLAPARRLWQRRVSTRQLPWFAVEKARAGAFAAFLGLHVDCKSQNWRALAMGDCCLFQLDNAQPDMRVVQLFPLSHSSEFSMGPFLVGSKVDPHPMHEHLKVIEGSLRPDDMLLLTTDAIAAWLLKRHEEGRPLWKWLYRRLRTTEDFAGLVEYARKNGLRNDDLTLVRVLDRSPVQPPKEKA